MELVDKGGVGREREVKTDWMDAKGAAPRSGEEVDPIPLSLSSQGGGVGHRLLSVGEN